MAHGFDFQINPYYLGGMYADLSSVPYPVQAVEQIDSVVDGAFNTRMVALVEEIETTTLVISGEMRSILLTYSHYDDLDAVMAVATGGELDSVLVSYDMGVESMDSLHGVVLNGSLSAILIVITMDTDSIDGVNAVATGGTLA